ncbi:MAG: SMC family ATPase [Singulisphaera sp.]
MIPRRIALKGFLCYRDEQVIDFDGADLWVFSGRNGSGKSAVFDALTFALFGAHRGGQRSADRLINADSPGFEVVFDFDLGDDRYRIKRVLRRTANSGERLIFRHEADERGEVHWRPVPRRSPRPVSTPGSGTSRPLLRDLHVLGPAGPGPGGEAARGGPQERYNVLAGVGPGPLRAARQGRRAGPREARAETYRLQVRPARSTRSPSRRRSACRGAEPPARPPPPSWRDSPRSGSRPASGPTWKAEGRTASRGRRGKRPPRRCRGDPATGTDLLLDDVLPGRKPSTGARGSPPRRGPSSEGRRNARGSPALDLTDALSGDMERTRRHRR